MGVVISFMSMKLCLKLIGSETKYGSHKIDNCSKPPQKSWVANTQGPFAVVQHKQLSITISQILQDRLCLDKNGVALQNFRWYDVASTLHKYKVSFMNNYLRSEML